MTIVPVHPWKGVRPWQRHSLVLMVAGFVFVGIGISYIYTVPTPSRNEALQVALSWWSFQAWGWHFITAGVLAIISSRWPPISKTWGYMVMSSLSAAWAGFYFTGVVFEGAPVSNLSGTLSWGLIAFLWWAISGLINPNDILERPIVVEDNGQLIDPEELL